ncbi:MAG: cellulase family glycosylhydrolase [Eubacteriales bacterium]|nr:cellulase family glycosylhydrolase [Eubacteriales bacterium]
MKFYTDGLVIRDQYGRQRIFRGENLCLKKPTLSPKQITKFLDTKLSYLKASGANIVRLGTTWAAIEPKEGRYNEAVIEAFHHFVKKCESMGIYVLLDMHQDLYSNLFHFGDGMPKWSVSSHIKPKRQIAIWAEGYFYMDGVQQCFCDFWNNRNNVQDKFVNAWVHFAKAFEDCDNIIGYDYLNEPYLERDGRKLFVTFLQNTVREIYNKNLDLHRHFDTCGDQQGFIRTVAEIAKVVAADGGPFGLLERMDSYEVFANSIKGLEEYTEDFNRRFYRPFVDKCHNAINKNCLSFFEHNYFSNMGVPFRIDTKERYIYSPHAYDLFVDSALYNKYSSNERIRLITDRIRANQLAMNVPVVFGEWGCGAMGNEWIDHIEYVMDIMEQNQWSNIYWAYRHTNKEFCHRINRPYPVAVCGNIIEYKTDKDNRIFTVTYHDNGKCEAPTEIYVPGKGIHRIPCKKGTRTVRIKY